MFRESDYKRQHWKSERAASSSRDRQERGDSVTGLVAVPEMLQHLESEVVFVTIFDLLKKCQTLSRRCKEIMDDCEFSTWEDISSDLYDYSDPDQRFLAEQLYSGMDCLERFVSCVEYLTREEVNQYRLTLAEDGRPVCYFMDYVVAHEYHCGYMIEYLAPNPDYDPDDPKWEPCPKLWKLSRVEHDGERYYIVGAPDLDLEGLRVRVRQRSPF